VPGHGPTRPALEVLEDRVLLAASVAPAVPAATAQPAAGTTSQAFLADSFGVLAQDGQAAVSGPAVTGVQGSVSDLAFTQASLALPALAAATPALTPGGGLPLPVSPSPPVIAPQPSVPPDPYELRLVAGNSGEAPLEPVTNPGTIRPASAPGPGSEEESGDLDGRQGAPSQPVPAPDPGAAPVLREPNDRPGPPE
jgi:hypothetical protein